MSLRQNAPRAVGPLDTLNDPGEVFRNPAQVDFIRKLIDAIRNAFGGVVSRDTANTHYHLISPGGKVYKVTVADSGALTTEYIRG